MLRCYRVVLALVAVCAVAVGLVVVVPSAAGAATHHAKTSKHKKKKKKAKKPAKPPKPVSIAPGVKVKYYNVKISKKRTVRTALLRFDMRNRHIRLDASTPRGVIGAGRQTITAQTRALRAVGGVNADFFDVREPSGTPNGGVVVNGVLVKSPRKDWDANFYVRGGRARIGALAFTATVTRAARPVAPAPDPSLPVLGPQPTPQPTPATSRTVTSVNNLKDLRSDKIVLVNNALASARLGRTCTVVVANPARTGGYAVTRTYPGVTTIRRVAGRTVVLAACGSGKRATWLANKIAVGDSLSIGSAIAGGTPSTLVSGGQVLVRGGRPFADRDGKTITGRNPETFGCVSKGGTKVILGTIDGRREGSSGVTISELRKYLLRLHCYHGIVFDGGGSSTLVGRPMGKAAVHVLNRPSDRGGARAVTSGLVLHRR